SWRGVRLYASGADTLRLRVVRDGESISIEARDTTGRLVLAVDAVMGRAMDRDRLAAAAGADRDALFGVDWVPLPAGSRNGSADDLAVLGELPIDGTPYADLAALEDSGAQPRTVLAGVAGPHDALELVRAWIGLPELADSRLVLVTSGGV